jgi:hypothetical protein
MFTPESQVKAQAARRSVAVRQTRKHKMQAFAATFAKQRRKVASGEWEKMALPLIAKVEGGSLPAAIKLMCLECSVWVRQEVRDCVVTTCPLYPVRPFQRAKGRNPNDP